ncbi:MAG TPA: alpha/beta hydrolase [Polyangiaceae bacterium]|nr:alpha/beta hydrolase [Polyangiaceae bacterium]
MIVIVHGWDGSGPGHWQHWLRGQLAERNVPHAFPELPDAAEPQLDAWLAALHTVVSASPTPVSFVAHSLGVWAVDHYLARYAAEGRVRAALLIAPPSPWSLFEPIQSFLPPPRLAASWEPLRSVSRLIGSDNDDHAGPEEIEELGTKLGLDTLIMPGAGHINAAAGFGPLPLALDWSLARHAEHG